MWILQCSDICAGTLVTSAGVTSVTFTDINVLVMWFYVLDHRNIKNRMDHFKQQGHVTV